MGILDRVKNMFTEEIDEPVSSEDVKEEVKERVDETKVIEEEKNIPKKEERMMPVFFDDQDFATLEKPKEEKKEIPIEERYYTKKTETTEKKVFKLSPVISPVYGVLDKNYHKEDITPKRSTPKVTYYDRESITIEEVRKKAYGSFKEEEVAEATMKATNEDEPIGSRMQRKYRTNGMFDDLMDPNYEPVKPSTTEEFEEFSKTIEPISLDDFLTHDEEELDEINYKDPNEDTLTESDLFHLIDSMYDKEDEE